ncbi:PREDICTED: cyclin-dependent kinase inhibitor 3 [Tarenaya hassleriana]|uniref:cyclin-dependent kinase inhibitor 3 n=1 Tax=Tarenaya hassleriana TaxID=28532 RepID=UPI00053C2910|nr:PREDICTED: cyclin-dependent kinase inhibitor 3 [Tarenaya hassleriana]
MGKYMKKSKITGDVGVMEVSQPTSLGVRTRAAKTLALQRLNSSSAAASAAAVSPATSPDGSAIANGPSCYLQLRSRRLEKPQLLAEPRKQQQLQRHQGSEVGGFKESGSRSRVGSVKSRTLVSGSVPVGRSCDGDGYAGNYGGVAGYEGDSVDNGLSETEGGKEVNTEASFGENNPDFEVRDRSTRESTPCNIAGDLHTIVAPGSSTRQRAAMARRDRDNSHRIVPTTCELEEFFVYAEQQQQRLFMEKYNFDVVNDLPLPGRYEWVQVFP